MRWKRNGCASRALDSAEGLRHPALPLIADGPGAREVSERFGDYGEAVRRLVGSLGDRSGHGQSQIPVFAWADLAPAKEALLRALAREPGLANRSVRVRPSRGQG